MSFSVRQVANTCSLNLASGTPPAAGYTILRTGVTYSTVAAALAAAQNGDSIGISAGTSVPNTAIEKSLTFYCLTPGSRYTMLGNLRNTDGTGTGVNRNIVVQDAYFGFFKAHPNIYGGPDNAPKCFNWSGEMTGSLIMRNCVFEDCPMPVFSSRYITDCLVEDCTFINCGTTDEPNTHGIYVHATNSLTVRGCTFYWTYSIPTGTRPIPSAAPYSSDNTWLGIGHHIKSRSLNTYVYACLIDNRLGSVSSQIDIAEGGSATIEGNIILEGPYSADDPTIGPPYAGDTQITSYIQDHVPQFPAGPFVLRQNTIVNYGSGTEKLIRLSGPVQPSSYDVRENLIVGPMADVPNANYPPSLNTITTSTTGVFVDPNANNFTPLSTTLGASNYATTAYQAVAQYISRTDAYRGGVPITAGLPAYISAHPVGAWFEVLPGTTINDFTFPSMAGQGFGPTGELTHYSGATVRSAGSWYLLKGGGHASTTNNILIGIQLSAASPAWTTISPCTPAAQIQSPYNGEPRYLDGRMCAGHSGYKDAYLQGQDRYVQIGSGVSFTGAGGSAHIDAYNWSAFTPPSVPSSTTPTGTIYYVSTSGSDSNSGTLASPFATLQKAHDVAAAGNFIYMRGGTYVFGPGQQTSISRSGSSGSPITVLNYPGETPILDASTNTSTGGYALLRISGAYWNFSGLELKSCPGHGAYILASAHDITMQNCNAHHNVRLDLSGAGIQVEGGSQNNIILLNNDSHHNGKPGTTGGDGIAQGSTGTGNIIRGNRTYRNNDDGIDLWGALGVVLDGNWSWQNGYNDSLVPTGGDGNGYKLGGGTTGDGQHTVDNNLAWGNFAKGFDANSADLTMNLFNNTAYNNGGYNFHFFNGTVPYVLKNNVSYLSLGANMGPSTVHSFNSWDIAGLTVTAADFASLDFSGATGARQSDGSLPTLNFLHLAAGSQLIGRGTNVGIPYSGPAPDLGAYEFIAPADGWIPSNTLLSPNQIYGAPNWVMGDTVYTANQYQLYSCKIGDLSTAFVTTFASSTYSEKYGACIVDSKRGALVWGGMLDPNYGSAQQLIRMLGAGTLNLSGVTIPLNTYGGGVYEPFLDRYLLLQVGASTVYSVDPDSGVVSIFPTTGSLQWFVNPNMSPSILGRMQYLTELKAIVFQEASDESAVGGRLMMMRTG